MRQPRVRARRCPARYLHDECGCRICGVEILPSAKPVQAHPFHGNTAFILGNEGHGLNEKQKAICDDFVYIPHYGRRRAGPLPSVSVHGIEPMVFLR